MITTWRGYALGGLLGAAFISLFSMAGGFDWHKSNSLATPISPISGNFQAYLYHISNIPSENKKLAQFEPSLPSNDTLVINTLKSVVKQTYNVTIPSDTQPAVQTINEINYITFKVLSDTFLFELFRNSNGQVGSARFWRETVSN
jgi:hypothetical protein